MAVGQAILERPGLHRQWPPAAAANCPDARDLPGRWTCRAARDRAGPQTVSPRRQLPQADKRGTLDLALDHLRPGAPGRQRPPTRPSRCRPPAAPFGSAAGRQSRCTLCLSCVGACPEGALLDNPDRPQLRFIETACVQCGLCAGTCPEKAITLQPRLWLADEGRARRTPRVLNEATPYGCVRCGKPFGTLKAIEAMLGKLAGHSAFQGAALERLKMCQDCRVIDIHTNPNEQRITDL
jgi:ferredoxin